MPELIDCQWFAQQSDDVVTIKLIEEVAQWQQIALRDNIMPLDTRILTFKLHDNEISIEAASAVNALEVYQEIFRDNDHQKVHGFSPQGKQRIIDLGANYGFYTLLVKHIAPQCQVVCIEPNPYIFPCLQKNLANYAKIQFLNAAIGTTNVKGEFDVIRQLPSIGGLTLRQVKRQWLQEDMIETIKVEYITLEEIFHRSGFTDCDILKVDVEGIEGDIFEQTPTAILQRAQRIVVERHTLDLHRRVIDRLTSADFTLEYDPDPDCRKHYGNLYFIRN